MRVYATEEMFQAALTSETETMAVADTNSEEELELMFNNSMQSDRMELHFIEGDLLEINSGRKANDTITMCAMGEDFTVELRLSEMVQLMDAMQSVLSQIPPHQLVMATMAELIADMPDEAEAPEQP